MGRRGVCRPDRDLSHALTTKRQVAPGQQCRAKSPCPGTDASQACFSDWMADDVLKRMKARVAQCRRLAAATTDERAATILRQMADEVEADIRRLEVTEEG